MKIAALFREMLPGCEVGTYCYKMRTLPPLMIMDSFPEKASIDEAFIDFTKPVRDLILERYPYLATVPSDAPLGIDTPLPPPPPVNWEGKGTIVPIHPPAPEAKSRPETTPSNLNLPQEQAAPSGSSTKVEDHDAMVEVHPVEDLDTTWHDVALSIASELMYKARQEVLTKLGYSTSAVSLLLLP